VIGFALLTGVAMLYSHVRGRDGLGLGDASIVALLVTAWRSQALSATTRIPFGPLLAFGTWIVWLYGAS
jgi:prepilin signal peptidase PulO-like enzyme (type II secretory pathway)